MRDENPTRDKRVQPNEQARNDGEPPNAGAQCQVLPLRVDELRPHLSYLRNQLSVSASQLSALAARGDCAFLEPLLINRNRVIIDGYARFELARRQGRDSILCIEYDL